MSGEAKESPKLSKVRRGGWGPFVPLIGGAPPGKKVATGMCLTKGGIMSQSTMVEEVDNELDEMEKALKDEMCRMQEKQDSRWKILDFIKQMQEQVDSKIKEVHERMESNLQDTKNIYKCESGIEKLERTLLNEIWEKHQITHSETQYFLEVGQIRVWQSTLEKILLEDTSRIQNKYADLKRMQNKHLDEIVKLQNSHQSKIKKVTDSYEMYQMAKVTYIDKPDAIENYKEESSEGNYSENEHSEYGHPKYGHEYGYETYGYVHRPEERREGSDLARYENEILDEILTVATEKKPKQKSTGQLDNSSLDDLEQLNLVNTLKHNTSKLQESQKGMNRISKERGKFSDEVNFTILRMKTSLRMLKSKQNLLDIDKWQSAPLVIKTEFSKGMEQRMVVNSKVLQDSKKTSDQIYSNMLIVRMKLSKFTRMKNYLQMNRCKKSLEEANKMLYKLLQKRKQIQKKMFEKIPKMQEMVTSMMQKLKLNIRSRLRKMLKLDKDLVDQAKSSGMCPSDMNAEKWMKRLEDLEKEMLEDIGKMELKIHYELHTRKDHIATEFLKEALQWKPTLEAMTKRHLCEKQEDDEKYREIKLFGKSHWDEMQKLLQEAQNKHVKNDKIVIDSSIEESEEVFFKEICQMHEKQGNMKESFDALSKIFELVDLKTQDVQKRIQLRLLNMVHKSPSSVESSELDLLDEMFRVREDFESDMKNGFVVQDWLSALQMSNLKTIHEMYSTHLDLEMKGSNILETIKDMKTTIDSVIEEMQMISIKYDYEYKYEYEYEDEYEPTDIKNIESEAKELEIMIKSYTDKNLATTEIHDILQEIKSIKTKPTKLNRQNLSIEQMQKEVLDRQWEERWELLQNKHEESKQEEDDVSNKMGELEKVLLEEGHMMQERQNFKTQIMKLLQENKYITNSKRKQLGEEFASEMVKMWRRKEVIDVQLALEKMNWEDILRLQQNWTSKKSREEIQLLIKERYIEELIGEIDEETTCKDKDLQYNKTIKETKEDNYDNIRKTTDMNLSKYIEECEEERINRKLEYNNNKFQFEAAKQILQTIKTEWEETEAVFPNIRDHFWSGFEDKELESALTRLKLVHGKEKKKFKLTIEFIENMKK